MFNIKFILTIIGILFITKCNSQLIYEGNSEYSEHIKCTIIGNKIYKENSSYSQDIIFTIQSNKIFRGNSSYSQDVIFTINNNKVYRGNLYSSTNIVATIKKWSDIGNNIKVRGYCIYKGNSSYSQDVIATFTSENGRVYKGFTLYSDSYLFRTTEDLNESQIICILYYLNVIK